MLDAILISIPVAMLAGFVWLIAASAGIKTSRIALVLCIAAFSFYCGATWD